MAARGPATAAVAALLVGLFLFGFPVAAAADRSGTSMRKTAASTNSALRVVNGMVAGATAAVEKSKGLTPDQFLLISSPKLSKICFAELRNFKAVDAQVFPLIDSGLLHPEGIALDRSRGYLYVNDYGARKIYRYTIKVNHDEEKVKNKMETDGVRLTIVEGIRSHWSSIDQHGNLFFSNDDTKAVNKLPFDTIQKIAGGDVAPSQLVMLSEQDQEAVSAAQSSARQNAQASNAGDEEDAPTYNIFSLYEAEASPHISEPSGLYVDGPTLFWGNSQGGMTKGAVVKGQAEPQAPISGGTRGSTGANTFPSETLANNTDQVRGVTKTRDALIYADSSHKVYAVGLSGAGGVFTLTDQIHSPRGLVWDGDNTVFVADSEVGRIWSFPSGRLSDGQPLDIAVDLDDAYGLALLQESDDGYYHSGATGPFTARARVALAAGMLLAFAYM